MEKSKTINPKTANRYSPEVRERAVRMVLEHQSSNETQGAAIAAIAPKIGWRKQNAPASTISAHAFTAEISAVWQERRGPPSMPIERFVNAVKDRGLIPHRDLRQGVICARAG